MEKSLGIVSYLNPYHIIKRKGLKSKAGSLLYRGFLGFVRKRLSLIVLFSMTLPASGQSSKELPFPAKPWMEQAELSSLMVQRVNEFLSEQTAGVKQLRAEAWKHDFANEEAFNHSIASQKALLRQRLGVVDQRLAPKLEYVTTSPSKPMSVETQGCTIYAVRWDVLEGMPAEGLLLQPKGKIRARIVLIPDADDQPEVLAGLVKGEGSGYNVGRMLAEAGWQVMIPVLVNRNNTYSGNPSLGVYSNMPHREWIYRQAYELGRHVIGYELQKVLSAIDWFELQNKTEGSKLPFGVAGYGEGGLLALYAAALDTRISSALVSGYFNAREKLWKEPIYRNVFGLLKYFGDAELAVMAWPHTLVVEHSRAPEVTGPPPPIRGRSGAAPGSISTPEYLVAKNEWNRAKAMVPGNNVHLHWFADKDSALKQPFSHEALAAFASGLNVKLSKKASSSAEVPKPSSWSNTEARQERAVRDMEAKVQHELLLAERTRNKDFWQLLMGDSSMQRPVKAKLRERFKDQLGSLPVPTMPANARGRFLQKTEKWTSYEVMLDVWPGVFAWGVMLIPNDLKPGEKRPVVVCQHGLEGVPLDVVITDPDSEKYKVYKGFASRLADRGYITFAPFNLYRGRDKFRVLQRMANPLELTLFSVMIGQHQRIVQWLKELSFVDPERIGFYGLSYGGKSAMRIPAVMEDYALSICSGDFNEWVLKSATTNYSFSYLFTGEYDMQEWDLGHTFNYAEMAALIAPRPFMVERGHSDGVATDEWVGYEYEKVRRHYDLLGLPKSTAIEYFVGPHTINGVGTFEFLDRFLKLPNK
jgi:dienelactone hydrolase